MKVLSILPIFSTVWSASNDQVSVPKCLGQCCCKLPVARFFRLAVVHRYKLRYVIRPLLVSSQRGTTSTSWSHSYIFTHLPFLLPLQWKANFEFNSAVCPFKPSSATSGQETNTHILFNTCLHIGI